MTKVTGSGIKGMSVYVEAETKEEAELILLKECYKFFDQDMTLTWGPTLEGYRQIDDLHNSGELPRS